MATRTKPVNASKVVSVRGRDAGRPSAPIRVSDEARSKSTNTTGVQKVGLLRRERNASPERPRTSSGPSPQFSARKEIERRRAKDDLHFNPLPTHGGVVNSHTPPLPGALPTPAGTPNSSPPVPLKSSLKRTDTPESMMNGRLAALSAEEAGIGMALGSPSQQHSPWQTPTTYDSTARSWSPDDHTDPYVPSRQKSSKWKILGGLFAGSKKQNLASEPQPFYHLQPEPVQHAMEPGDYVYSAEPRNSNDKRADRPGTRGRAYSERKNVQTKPGMRRAQTVPINFDSQDAERERKWAPKITLDGEPIGQQGLHHGGLMLNVDIPSIEMERYSVMFGSVLQKPASASSSALLARRQATLQKLKSVAESLPKQQDMRGHHRQPLPRRASSPQPTKSPGLSLFPNTPSRPYGKNGPPSPPQQSRVHRRSNTSPAVPSPSFPSFPSFPPRPDYEAQATLLVSSSLKSKDHISSQMRQPGKDTPKTPVHISATHQRIEQASTHERHRKTSDESVGKVEGSSIVAPLQSMSKTGDSARQVVHSPPEPAASHSPQDSRLYQSRGYSVSVTAMNTTTATPTSRSASARKNSPLRSPPPTSLFRSATITTGTVSQKSRIHSAALNSNPVSVLRYDENEAENIDDEEREAKLRTAADVSIARQISVSREQTRLIIPMRSPSSNRANSPNALTIGQVASPLGNVAAGIEKSAVGRPGNRRADAKKTTKERLAAPVVKPSTPTLVIVGGDSTEEVWGGVTALNETHTGEARLRTLAERRHRKSERVIVESISISD